MPDIVHPSAPPVPAPRRNPPAVGLPRARGRTGAGAVASLLFHGLLVALVFWRGAELLAGGGKGPGPRGGGGGGGVMRFFVLAASGAPKATDISSAAAKVPVQTVPLPDPRMLALPKVSAPPAPVAPATPVGTTDGTGGNTGSGPGSGGGQGSGTGPGVGVDSGPGTGGGDGYTMVASPRWSLLPPGGAPKSVHGHPLSVRFWLTADGAVTRVEVDPPIRDAAYAKEFMEKMRGYTFFPFTTRDGRRVAGVATVTVVP
ncbi:MAG TPA: hypothetical protein VNG95_05205 [Gemmatimonadales bacterium]|nr:hypothetical protein [Gemmatimonadales bacterium]